MASLIQQLKLKIQEQEQLILKLQSQDNCCTPFALRCSVHRPHQHQVQFNQSNACQRKTRFGKTTKLVDLDEMNRLLEESRKPAEVRVQGRLCTDDEHCSTPASPEPEVISSEPQPESEVISPEPQPELELSRETLEQMKLPELKALCKDRKLKGFSRYKKKADLILFLIQSQ